MITIPKFDKKKDLFDFLVKNKQDLIAQKKQKKSSDSVISIPIYETKNGIAIKKNAEIEGEIPAILKVKVIGNTTNWFDSHKDVHLPGLWKKTLQEQNGMLIFAQEHGGGIDKVIADGNDLKVYTQNKNWQDIGYNAIGQTEALVAEANVIKERNEFMHKQYANDWVRNHSVEMQYVSIVMAVNDKDYGDEYEAWKKYVSQIINRKDVEREGYFWVIKEAKLFEVNAVKRGSNIMTPVENNNIKSYGQPQNTQLNQPQSTDYFEPESTDKNEPEKPTQPNFQDFVKYLNNNLKK